MPYCRLSGVGFLTDETEKVSRHLGDSRLVEEVKVFLAAHLDKHFTLNDICEQFWVSRTALSKKFRKVEGKGVMDYFIDLKIDEAKTRIRRSAASFTDIAEALGFSSVGYFSKIFKSRVGMTPTEYSKYSSKRRAAATDGE
jgi:AraC-like DNA-binding protein